MGTKFCFWGRNFIFGERNFIFGERNFIFWGRNFIFWGRNFIFWRRDFIFWRRDFGFRDGDEIPKNAKFCPGCGAKVVTELVEDLDLDEELKKLEEELNQADEGDDGKEEEE